MNSVTKNYISATTEKQIVNRSDAKRLKFDFRSVLMAAQLVSVVSFVWLTCSLHRKLKWHQLL